MLRAYLRLQRCTTPTLRHRCYAQKGKSEEETGDDTRGYKYDSSLDLPGMLANQREVGGELEGFKSRLYQSDPEDPEHSNRVLAFFRSRKSPTEEKQTSTQARNTLNGPREAVPKTADSVSSMIRRTKTSSSQHQPEQQSQPGHLPESLPKK